MLSLIKLLSLFAEVGNKFLPSRDEKSGRAKEKIEQYDRIEEARAQMGGAPELSDEEVLESLDKGKF